MSVHFVVRTYCTSCLESLASLILYILTSCVNTNTIHKWVEDVNHEQPTSLMALLLVLLPGSQLLCWSHSAMGASTYRKRWQKCFICPMCPAAHPHRPCVMYLLDCYAWVFTFWVTFCGLRFHSHSDDGHVHASALYSVCVFTQACSTMSCTHLV